MPESKAKAEQSRITIRALNFVELRCRLAANNITTPHPCPVSHLKRAASRPAGSLAGRHTSHISSSNHRPHHYPQPPPLPLLTTTNASYTPSFLRWATRRASDECFWVKRERGEMRRSCRHGTRASTVGPIVIWAYIPTYLPMCEECFEASLIMCIPTYEEAPTYEKKRAPLLVFSFPDSEGF